MQTRPKEIICSGENLQVQYNQRDAAVRSTSSTAAYRIKQFRNLQFRELFCSMFRRDAVQCRSHARPSFPSFCSPATSILHRSSTPILFNIDVYVYIYRC